jgi:hypothetical protein
MGSRRASGGAGEQDTGLVVGWVAIPAAGPLDLFDGGVRGLVRALVTRWMINTSIAGHQASMVAQSRHVSSVSVAST